MSSDENVAIVRRAYEAAARRPPDFATVNALYHHDHELISIAARVEGRAYVGARGFREWLVSVEDTWASFETTGIERIQSLDPERVLIVTGMRLRGRRGGVPIEQPNAQIMTVRDGKIARTEIYTSLQQALDAAGLTE